MMKKTICTLAITMYGLTALAQTGWSWTTKPQYELISDFSEGLAAVKIGGKWGYINPKGKLVIPAKYTAAASFSEGLAAVNMGKTGGFINKKNEVVIPPRKGYFNSFSDGRAVYFKPSDKPNASPYETTYGFIDKTGKMVIAPTRHISPNVTYTFFEGFCKVMDKESLFINRNGKPLEMAKVSDAQDFSEGLAAVQSASGPKWGFMNTKGTVVIPFRFYEVDYTGFKQGLCAVALQYNEWMYINRSGKPMFGQTFKEAKAFSEGMAAVAKEVGGQKLFGFIDKNGKMTIKPQFKPYAYKAFSEGLVAFKKGAKWGFMDKRGQVAIQPQFENVGSFKEGRCPVKYQGKWGAIRKK
ncbi:MAG TPA: hypothetical protein DCS93_16995 [Microscillaceae bacterium]|nr:hypothetical protein [Microscillaceae bacterium]